LGNEPLFDSRCECCDEPGATVRLCEDDEAVALCDGCVAMLTPSGPWSPWAGTELHDA